MASRRYLPCLCFALGVLGCEYDVELVRAPRDVEPVDARAPRWDTVASGTTSDLRAVWGTGPGDVWAVGDMGTAIHWDGAMWRGVPTGTGASLSGVWAARPNEAWAVGANADNSAVVLRWDGARWSGMPPPMRGPAPMRAVWGSASGDVWVVGGSPDVPEAPVWRWDGSMWRPEFPPGGRPPSLTAVAGSGADDVWAVGNGPVAFHRTRGMWTVSSMLVPGGFFGGSLCVTVEGAVWAVGVSSVAYRYSDPGWAPSTLPPMTTPRGLWCGRSDDIWVVGDGGRVAHWNGSAWSPQAAPRVSLAAAWGTGTGELWAVGPRGAVVRYVP